MRHTDQAVSGNVAANIRAEMARKRVTQQTIAQALGLTQQSVSARVNGRVALNVDELHVIAGVLAVDAVDLMATSARGQRSAS